MFVENEKELGKALKDGKEKIEIKGDLAKRMKKIYELDQVLWGICFVCLTVTVAVFLTMPATAGVSSAISLAAGTPVAAAVGLPTAVTAVLTAAAGGGIHILKWMRKKYTMEQLDDSHIVLCRKKGRENIV